MKRPPSDERPLVLVVEDDLILGMTLVDTLESAGFAIAGPARRIPEALGLIAHQRLDAALLDMTIQEEASFPVAKALRARSIPFAFLTGDLKQVLPPDYADVPRLEKPLAPVLLATVLEKLIQGR